MTTETQAPEGGPALIDNLLMDLDQIARDRDSYEYGLPIDCTATDGPMEAMREKVRAALAAQPRTDLRDDVIATLRGQLADLQALCDERGRKLYGDDGAALAAQPQAALQYQQANPLGGPAKVFRAIADAIEAGDSYEDTLRRYGYAEAQPAPAEGDERAAEITRQLSVASVVIGNLPALPGSNGSIMMIDDEEAARIEKCMDEAIAWIEGRESYQRSVIDGLRADLAAQPQPKDPADADLLRRAGVRLGLFPEDDEDDGTFHGRTGIADPAPAPEPAVRFVNGCNYGGRNCGRSACERECCAPRQKAAQAPAVEAPSNRWCWWRKPARLRSI